MDKKEYILVQEVQDTHWWWQGRKKIIEEIIKKFIDFSGKLSIADVGCGYGANISFLRQYGDVTGLELSEDAIRRIQEKWGESVELIRWSSPEPVARKFDFILMADVLEHIPDDDQAVTWLYDHLNEGGGIIDSSSPPIFMEPNG